MSNLSAADRKVVQRQLVQLPPRTKAAQEKEMGEMMGKLKEVSLHHSCVNDQSAYCSSLVMAYSSLLDYRPTTFRCRKIQIQADIA